jgi:hypothetical protein
MNPEMSPVFSKRSGESSKRFFTRTGNRQVPGFQGKNQLTV